MIDFVVAGIPQPAGSKKIVTARGGARVGRPILIDDASNRSRGWRKTVAAAARDAMEGREPLEGPLSLMLVFSMPRPAYHFGTGRNADTLKPSAPARPTVKPDVLKLARLVEDVLTGIVYLDDAQIVFETLTKRYGRPDWVGAQIFVDPFEESFVDRFDEMTRQLPLEETHA